MTDIILQRVREVCGSLLAAVGTLLIHLLRTSSSRAAASGRLPGR
jgi:hypothetical protein